MTPQAQLRNAHRLMVAGMAPLFLGIALVGAILAAEHTRGEGLLGLLGIVVATYLVAVIIAGGGALWSGVLVRRHPGLDTRHGKRLRRLVLALLVVVPVLTRIWTGTF